MKNAKQCLAKWGRSLRNVKLMAGWLLLFLAAIASFAQLTGAEQFTNVENPLQKDVRVKKQLPSSRKLIFSEKAEHSTDN